MRYETIKKIFTFLLLLLPPLILRAQPELPLSCFNALEVNFPLSENDYSKNKVLVNSSATNAFYYLYQDKYTFWYKFVVRESAKIQFSVSPTNDQDRYLAVVYQYGASDFCDQLVNFNLQPITVERAPMFMKGEKLLYLNTIEAQAGDTFYVSVLSLNENDCGHFLRIQSADESLSLNAIHRPCYSFEYLQMPSFSTAKMQVQDVTLFLDLQMEKPNEEDKLQETTPHKVVEDDIPPPKSGFESLSTIEIQSADDEMISVGDKLVLNNVFFYTNTYAFKPEATEELDQLYGFLSDNPTVQLEIQGHTANNSEEIRPDPNFKNQGPEWNFKGSALKLSEMRARAVETYLVEKGIPKKRLKSVGYGDTQKRVPEASTFEESEKNMRVEALVIKQ